MNKIKKLNLLLGVALLTTIVSCSNEPNLSVTESQSKQEDWVKLGKKLENPYSIKNMRLALKNLKAKKSSLTSREAPIDAGFDVEPNYLYVEFEPKTEAEEAVLKQDSSVVLFDYPLDYEFTEEVLDARPALLSNQFPNYYTAIKIDSETASEAQYEILEELYIPEEDPYFGSNLSAKQKISTQKETLLDELLDEAFKITGNERQNQLAKTNATAKWIFGKRWWPSGTITIYDEVARANKPVVGAQVLIRQWFTVRQGITDENGNFSTSSIRGSARYVLQWERYNYSIRNGSFFQAETKSATEQKDVPWNLNITGGDDKYHALIHQAAHDYYYGHRFGLISPPMNNHLYSFGRQSQMKIAARETAPWGFPSSYSHIRSDLTYGLSAQIHIKKYGSPDDEVYGTTIHELSHALHSVLDRGSYDNIVRDAFLDNHSSVQKRNRRLLETWPTTVEIMMTLERYRTKFGNPNYQYRNNNKQFVTILAVNDYTSGGFDLIDNFNQRDFYGLDYPIDRVNGYTLKQLEQSLIGAKYWSQWRDNLKNKYDNPTEQFVDELFNNWQD
ncbi:hypothetical protein [Flavobacterium sp. TAB 87]|uniref:hypothetical protein n=1 Tax=Flavobacterium sp. TAB 87 TaxID=1729581 RepID=UPI00076D6851|nr:hypothetical protein [Flavobacterium sp. TAB 87]KVV16444.1 hypothetical protein AP058_00012 [Flavobacterium sp. TAB 87]